MTDKQILDKVDEAIKLGRKQALEDVYYRIRDMFNRRIILHNSDYDRAESEQCKYDLSRDAREFIANFDMILDEIKELLESEG